MSDPIVRTRWDRLRVQSMGEIENEDGELVKDPGRTQQHHGPSVDIRNILMAAKKGIPIESVAWGEPRYGDFSNVDDYVTARQRIAETEEDFAGLPALIRARFQNNPALLVQWLANPGNHEEAVKLGILPKPDLVEQKTGPSPVAGGESPPELTETGNPVS